MGIATAILGGASLIGGIMGSNSAKKAAKQQTKAQQAALAEQRRQYDENKALLTPFITPGQNALATYSNAVGLNGRDAQQAFYNDFEFDPGFNTALDDALSDTSKRYAIYGDVGGGLAKDLLKTGQSARMSAYDKRLAQIGGIADSGRSAAGSLSSAGQANANAQSGILSNIGATQAQGTMNASNALVGGIGNFANAFAYGNGINQGMGGNSYQNLNGVNGFGNSWNALTVPYNRVSF